MSYIKKYKKQFLILILIPFLFFIIPLFNLIIKIIFTYGTYVGSFIRKIAVGKVC